MSYSVQGLCSLYFANLQKPWHISKFCACNTSHYPKEGPWELPEGWEWTTIGDVFIHNTGKALNSADREGRLLPYITTSNLYWDRFELSTLKKMLFTEDELEKCTARKGDLLVCEGGDIGRAAIWNQDYEIRIQNHIHKLRGLGGVNHRLFMFWLMYMKEEGMIGGKGIGLMGLSSRELDKLLIPLPPLCEQSHLVDKIDGLFSVVSRIEKAETILFETVSIAKSRILDFAIHGKLVPQDPSDEPAIELLKRINPDFKPSDNLHYGASVPAGWQLCHIQDIASVELGKTLDRLKNSGEEKPYLCVLNVKWDTFDLSTVKTIRIASSEKERYAVKPGDLLVCEGGDVGRAAIWTEHIEMYYQNALHRIRFKTQDICQEFFLYVLRNYKDRGIIDDVCKGVTIKHFTGQVFRSLDLPIPPLKEQKRIIDSVNAYCNILEKLQQA